MKNKAAQALGSLGGKARAAKLSKQERQAIARKAAKKRWSKHRKNLKDTDSAST